MYRTRKPLVVWCAALAVVLAAASLAAEPASAADEVPENIQEKIDGAANVGHNAWMMTCCALVLFMTAPGLAMFYGGLVRKKNVLGVMMQCVFLMCLMTVVWALWGYTLACGGAEGGDVQSLDRQRGILVHEKR
jgi:Amt family ammonium transporter